MTEHPPGWHPDPRGRHEHRYWDGTKWTDHVSDAGVTSQDPVTQESVDSPAPTQPSSEGVPASHAEPPATAEPARDQQETGGPEEALEKAAEFLDSTAASMSHKPLSLAALLTVALPGFGHLYLGGDDGRRTKGIGLLVATVVAANVASWISWPIGLLMYLAALGFALGDLRGDLAPMQQQRAGGGPLAMFSDLGPALSWRLALVGGALLAMSLVLPWYRVSEEGFSASASAFEAFSLIDVILLLIGAGAAVLATIRSRDATSERDAPGRIPVILTAAAALALMLVVYRLLFSPAGLAFEIERSFGAYLAFIAAVLLAGGAAGAAAHGAE